MRYLSAEGVGVGRVVTVRSRGPWIYLFINSFSTDKGCVDFHPADKGRIAEYIASRSYLHIFPYLDCTRVEIGPARIARRNRLSITLSLLKYSSRPRSPCASRDSGARISQARSEMPRFGKSPPLDRRSKQTLS